MRPTMPSASRLVWNSMPCWVLKWNFTQWRSPAALMKREGVRAEAVHEARRVRDAAIGEQDRHLVQALRRQRPEIPHRRRRAQVGLRVALLRVDEVGELVGVAHEEHRRVVADQIPVALLGIELERKAAHVALGVGGAELAGNGGEARQHLRLLADGGEYVGGRIRRDVVGDGERAVGAPALGVHRALGDALAVLVRQLFDQLIVLHQQRAERAGGQRVLVVGNRCAGSGREALIVWRTARHGGAPEWLREPGGEQPATIAVK